MYRVAFAAFAGLCVSSHPVALECGTTRLEVGQTIMGSTNIAGAAADGVNFTIADASNHPSPHLLFSLSSPLFSY